MFCVVRHPDIDSPGMAAEASLPLLEVKGWVRVSDFRESPSDFHLDEYADADVSDETPSPAEPEEDEEQ
jgi:hypothetical protein